MQSTTQSTTQSIGENKGFDQMAQGLRSAMENFEQSQHPEMIAAIVSALKPVSEYATQFWNMTSRLVRRHPVQTTVAVCALGFVIAAFMKPNLLSGLTSTSRKPRRRSR